MGNPIHPSRPSGIGDCFGEARELTDTLDDDAAFRLHGLLDRAEDCYMAYDVDHAADWLRTIARVEDVPAAREILGDLADAISEGE